MSTTFNVISGDTFESISRKKFGVETEASRIAEANPGVNEPLTEGLILTIPDAIGTPKNKQQSTGAVDDNEVAILINGQRFRFWDKIRLVNSLDAIDIIEFSVPFDVNIPGFKDIFRPFSYQTVVVTLGGETIFTGTMLTPMPTVENKQKTISVSCYSLPGVLNDCTPPASMFGEDGSKLEFNEQGLTDIVPVLVAPFGISVDFQGEQGAIFDTVAIEPEKKVFTFLVELIQQRNLIMTSGNEGELIIWNSTATGQPVARLEQGVSPLVSITPFFNPQQYYSHITGLDPVAVGLAGSQYTVKNARLAGVTRPFTFSAPDTTDSNIKLAVESKAGRMFGSIVSYSINVNTWRDSAGKQWEPNTTIKVVAPDAMIYNEYEFIIRSVQFEKDQKTEKAILNLVLPGSFSGEIPNNLPWD